MQVQEELKNFLFENGVADVGFTCVDDGPFGEKSYAMSIVVKLSDAVIDEITDEPTHSYFHHYRTVNAFIDRTLLQCGFILEKHGYKYIPIGASQSVNKDGWNYCGRYSHKKIATLSGLGGIGKIAFFFTTNTVRGFVSVLFSPIARLKFKLTNIFRRVLTAICVKKLARPVPFVVKCGLSAWRGKNFSTLKSAALI